jgi:hypothetical protein
MPLATSLRRALGLSALLLLLGALVPGCSTADPPRAPGGAPVVRPQAQARALAVQPPMPTNARVVFLHHSTGSAIWEGGVPGWFTAYNTAHGTTYQITELAYPGAPYPWDNYPYDYWNIWVNHAGTAPYQGNATLELLTPQYEVIAFKHCFPVSGIAADAGTPDVTSSEKTVGNYKAQYAALKTKLRSFPANRFIVWTGAALLQVNNTPEQAARAKEFFDWVRTVWDEPGDNIYVWDFFDLETGGGIYMLPENGGSDSHPNPTFAAEAAPLFGQRVVDVIAGKGDSSDSAQVPPSGGQVSLALDGANPALGPVRLRLDLPVAAKVRLTLHDVAGRMVALLAEGESPAGTRYLTWDARAAGVRAGVYFARLTAGARELSRRFVILD